MQQHASRIGKNTIQKCKNYIGLYNIIFATNIVFKILKNYKSDIYLGVVNFFFVKIWTLWLVFCSLSDHGNDEGEDGAGYT